MQNNEQDRPFLILSLAGGGYRGLFTAEILRRLEEDVGSPLREHFDLIAGTSIGGILGLGVAKGLSGEQLVKLLKETGPRIFTPKDHHRVMRAISPRLSPLTGLQHALYSAAPLKEALSSEAVFGESTIGDLQTRVMIPAVNLSKGSLSMFKTPHHETFMRDWKYKLVDVALATSAAPTYFPVHEFANQRWADGGLVANDPAMQAVHEAVRFIRPGCREHVRVISIGTAGAGAALDQGQSLDMGKLAWAPLIFDITINSQSMMCNDIMKHWLNHDQYFQIDRAPKANNAKYFALDNASDEATRALLEHATVAVKESLGSALIKLIREHRAEPAKFFHGPNSNVSTQGEGA